MLNGSKGKRVYLGMGTKVTIYEGNMSGGGAFDEKEPEGNSL